MSLFRGSWLYASGAILGTQVTSSAGAALAPSPLDSDASARATAARRDGVSPSALTASPDPSYGSAPPARQKPPAEAYSDDPPVNVSTTVPDSPMPSAAANDRGAGEPTASDSSSAPALPAINVDRITTAIGENAKARADSLGRKTVTVKPADFDKPKP